MRSYSYGLIGLGRIGSGIFSLLEKSGHNVSLYDTKSYETLENGLSERSNLCRSLEEFRSSLGRRCVVFICIPSGCQVDTLIDQLLIDPPPQMTLVDMGNSFYEDSIRRSSVLKTEGVGFIDVGVSGGVGISVNGACLMIGGNSDEFSKIQNVLLALQAGEKLTQGPAQLGAVGSGHFVKMIHNGIEYAFLQLWTEFVHFHSNVCGLGISEVAEKVRLSRDKTTSGYISEITCRILDERDSDGEPLLHKISDFCGANGTGALTSITAARYGLPCNVLATAVECRQLQEYRRTINRENFFYNNLEERCGVGDVELSEALRLAYACAFTQGLQIIKAVSSDNGWNLDLRQILDVWSRGSIIRGGWIDELLSRSASTTFDVGDTLDDYLVVLQSLRKVVSDAISHGYSMPCHSAALSFLDSILMERTWIPLVAAQRDYFGGHGFQIRGSCETQRRNWA